MTDYQRQRPTRPANTSTVTLDDELVAWLGEIADRNQSTIMGVAGVLLAELRKEPSFVQDLEAEGLFPARRRRGRPLKSR